MKKLVFLFAFALTLSSCSLGDDGNPDFHTEFLPIETVDIPSEFVIGETYEITVTYYRPTTCYAFNDFYYQSDLNQRTVAVINTVYDNAACEALNEELVDASFNFRVTSNGTYVFRFFQGEDANGSDIYYIVEVPVVE